MNQGVSPDGASLIITFVVEEGPRTLVSGVEIVGNSALSDDVLKAELPKLEGTYFSRAKIRNGQRKLAQFYSQAGYYDAKVDFSIDERLTDPHTGEHLFKVVIQSPVGVEGQRSSSTASEHRTKTSRSDPPCTRARPGDIEALNIIRATTLYATAPLHASI